MMTNEKVVAWSELRRASDLYWQHIAWILRFPPKERKNYQAEWQVKAEKLRLDKEAAQQRYDDAMKYGGI